MWRMKQSINDFACIFANCSPILKILSLADSVVAAAAAAAVAAAVVAR